MIGATFFVNVIVCCCAPAVHAATQVRNAIPDSCENLMMRSPPEE
jgi:hypothetical protein